MIDKIKNIVSNVSGVNEFIYNDLFKTNIALDSACYPCAVVLLVPEWRADIKNVVRERATIQLYILVPAAHDADGFEIAPDLETCKEIFLNCVHDLREEFKIVNEEIVITAIYDAFDNGNCGVLGELEIENKQPRCLSSYGADKRIFDNTFDNTFN